MKKLTALFTGKNLIWQIIAVASTFLLVESGADWRYFEFTRGSFLQTLALSAAAAGFLVPVILPVVMYALGKLKNSLKVVNASIVVIQAEAIALLLSSVYKAFTGRIQPDYFTSNSNAVDISGEFHFGFLQHGIFWGWPSSHTTVAFALAGTLIALYPRNKILRYSAILYALYIGLGVSMSIHWLSDAVAGAIFGMIIGLTIGKNEKAVI